MFHNEQIKLTAGWLNTLAAALVAAGAFAPVAAVIYGISVLPIARGYIVVAVLCCLVSGFILHLAALTYIRRLRE